MANVDNPYLVQKMTKMVVLQVFKPVVLISSCFMHMMAPIIPIYRLLKVPFICFLGQILGPSLKWLWKTFYHAFIITWSVIGDLVMLGRATHIFLPLEKKD